MNISSKTESSTFLQTTRPTLFNHRIDWAYPTSQGIPGYQYYSSRALILSKPGDVVQMHPGLKEYWGLIEEHYRNVGLTHAQTIVWNEDPSVAAQYPTYDFSVYKFDTHFQAIRPDDQLLAVVEELDSKNHFVELAKKLMVPVPKTTHFQSVFQFTPSRFEFPYVIKRSRGTSGLGVFICRREEDVNQALQAIGHGSPFQVQEYIEPITWGSVLYHIDHEHIARQVGITEQILSGTHHVGSRGTSRYVYHLTDKIAEYMAEKNFRGCFGIDLAFTEKGAYAIECNPRLTGGVYPAVLAKKLGFEHQWFAKDIDLWAPTIDLKAIDDLVYRPGKESGAIIFTWLVPIGKIRPLIVGTPQEQVRIYEELTHRIGIKIDTQ